MNKQFSNSYDKRIHAIHQNKQVQNQIQFLQEQSLIKVKSLCLQPSKEQKIHIDRSSTIENVESGQNLKPIGLLKSKKHGIKLHQVISQSCNNLNMNGQFNNNNYKVLKINKNQLIPIEITPQTSINAGKMDFLFKQIEMNNQQSHLYQHLDELDFIMYSDQMKQKPFIESRSSLKNTQQQKIVQNSKGKQKKKKKKKIIYTQFSEMTPNNVEEEKLKFFQKNCLYDPIFSYNINEINLSYNKPHYDYLQYAIKILDECLQIYGKQYYVEQGDFLTMEQTSKYFQEYIDNMELQDHLYFEFKQNQISPTYIQHNQENGKSKIIVGLPITYHEDRIMGVLHHEIGTHFIRRYNNKQQLWFKNKKKFEMKPYSISEEGLATINQLFNTVITENKPYLQKQALHYYAAALASKVSFQELYQLLSKYIQDPDKIWKHCMRVKRGIINTQDPQGMYKDQIYFRGAVDILKDRKKIDFIKFHSGKLCLSDYYRLSNINSINTINIKLPIFLQDIDFYNKVLDTIAETNNIDQMDVGQSK